MNVPKLPVLVHRNTTVSKQVLLDRLGMFDPSWAIMSERYEIADCSEDPFNIVVKWVVVKEVCRVIFLQKL